MTYSNAPEIPTDIGDQWTNPDTGVVYEWNGERWIVIESHNHTETYVNRTGDTMLGPLIIPGTPRYPTEVTNKDYVDDEVNQLKVEIAAIAIEKGSARNYFCSSVAGTPPDSADSAPGRLTVDQVAADDITTVELNLVDIGGQATRIPEEGDILELDRINDGKNVRFVVSAITVTTFISVTVTKVSGLIETILVNDAFTVYIYPQNAEGVSQEELQIGLDLKVDRNGDTMTGPLVLESAAVVTNKINVQKVDTANDDIRVYNKQPQNWDKSNDFTFWLDLTNANSFHNKFKIVGNKGTMFTAQAGTTPSASFSNLKSLKIADTVDEVESKTVIKYTGDALTDTIYAGGLAPRSYFDGVLHDIKDNRYTNVWIDRNRQSISSDPGLRIKSNGNSADLRIVDTKNTSQIQMFAEGTNAPYISMGLSAKPIIQETSHRIPVVAQVAAPARMGWRYTSSSVPAAGSFYYSATSMKFSYTPKVGQKIAILNSAKWSLTPNTYFTVWEYNNFEWKMLKTGHVTEIEYVPNGLTMKHDELMSSGVLQKDGTIYYVTVGGFLS